MFQGDVADSLDAADADVSVDDVADALMDTVLPPDRRCNGSRTCAHGLLILQFCDHT